MKTNRSVIALGIAGGVPTVCIAVLSGAALGLGDPPSTLPPVPIPVENPLTEEKRVLGKILFWDEQMSFDNTMSCGSCHQPKAGGGDPRVAQNPGPDLLFNTPDDVFGSPGVVRTDIDLEYNPHPEFGFTRQATGRTAPTMINAAFLQELFWDGRAGGEFVNPETGEVSIAAGGALESQAAGPPLSGVEMAHDGQVWSEITGKLETARPLALATDLPPDVADVLASFPSYGELFEDAFGDPAITAERIAFAIASYQRTLISDQAPWDDFVRGVPGALSALENQGRLVFGQSRCNVCHTPPLFAESNFRNIGVRPVGEDRGRQDVTGNPADRGKFRTPTLRNVALRETFMHNGQRMTLEEVMQFYANVGNQQFQNNIDPVMALVNVPPQNVAPLVAFMGALTDPRVANETFPFDRPTLNADRATPNPMPMGGGLPGASGVVPSVLAVSPPVLGFEQFRIGLANATPGTTARVMISDTAPISGDLAGGELSDPIPVESAQQGSGTPGGFATFTYPIADDARLEGRPLYMQWVIDDPGAAGGEARTRVIEVTPFCGTGRCVSACPADWNTDFDITIFDVLAFLGDWDNQLASADYDDNGSIDVFDILAFLADWNAGCPS